MLKQGNLMVRLLFSFFILTFPFLVFASENTCKPVVAVYPLWKHNSEVLRSLPWDRFTHLAVFGVHPNENADLVNPYSDKSIENISQLAHAKGKKVIASIGGAGEASKAFRKIATDKKLRSVFSQKIIAFVNENNLDGIDIDWEYWTLQNEKGQGGNDPSESKSFVTLMSELRKSLSQQYILSVDIMAGPWVGEQYLPELQHHVDYVNLMAFDFSGQWSASPISHHADFNTFKMAIDYSLAKGFAKEKLLLGLPTYGKEFVDGKNEKVISRSYSDIVQMLLEKEYPIHKGKFKNLYFETQENVKKKSEYVATNGLAGVFLFELTSDHTEAKFSLLDTASHILNNQSCYELEKPRPH